MTDLKALLERVEAATGPDRESDVRLWAALGKVEPAVDPWLHEGPLDPAWRCNGRTMHEAIEKFPNDMSGIARSWEVEQFTASIDAALALVERLFGLDAHALCYSYDLGWHASAHAEMAFTADLHLAVGDPAEMQTFHGQAAALPLAIIAALLSALIAKDAQQ